MIANNGHFLTYPTPASTHYTCGMETEIDILAKARSLFEQGYTFRQIARQTDQLPSVIKEYAQQHNWVAGTATDWAQLRTRFECGEDLVSIAKSCTVSLATLRKRKKRENWSREQTRGIDALRRAVASLESALHSAPAEDAVLTMRISTALSMAAGRLSRAEKGLTPIAEEPETQQNHTDDEQAVLELERLLGQWRVNEEE